MATTFLSALVPTMKYFIVIICSRRAFAVLSLPRDIVRHFTEQSNLDARRIEPVHLFNTYKYKIISPYYPNAFDSLRCVIKVEQEL